MRKLLLAACAVLLFGSAAMAQGKLVTKWHCNKQTVEHRLEVGDMPNHTYGLIQGTCSGTPGEGTTINEKTGAYTEFQELKGTSMSVHGRFNVTLDNGDTVYYTYEGTGSTDNSKPLSNKWKIKSGTGKHKGVKGSGTCSGKMNADGSSDWECTGTYSTGM